MNHNRLTHTLLNCFRLFLFAGLMWAALSLTSQPARAAGPWYVTPGGNDSNTMGSPSIVTNGDFEMPVIGSGAWTAYYTGQTFDGWTVESGSIDLYGEGVLQVASGSQAVDLSGYEAGVIHQDLPTLSGKTYLLQFALAGNPADNPVCGPVA